MEFPKAPPYHLISLFILFEERKIHLKGVTGGEGTVPKCNHSEKYMDQGILLDLTDYIEKDANTDLGH